MLLTDRAWDLEAGAIVPQGANPSGDFELYFGKLLRAGVLTLCCGTERRFPLLLFTLEPSDRQLVLVTHSQVPTQLKHSAELGV